MLDEFKPLMSKVDPSNDRLCIIGESDPFLTQLIRRFAEKSGLWILQARTGNDVLELVSVDRCLSSWTRNCLARLEDGKPLGR